MLKLILPIIFSLFAVNAAAKGTTKTSNSVVTLSEMNTLSLRGPVTYSTVATLQAKLISMSNKLPANANIYLVLDTPGGSVDAGLALIDTARGLPQRVVTITSFAASMGFITAQMLGPRLILPGGVLMSHRARATVGGQIPGELNTRAQFLQGSVEEIEKIVAKRMNMTHRKYSRLILNEYWTYGAGAKAVIENAADQVTRARCDSTLQGVEKESVETLFGRVTVTFSKCPLVSAPLSFEFDDSVLFMYSSKERMKIERQIKLPYLKKLEYLNMHVQKNNLGVFL